MGEGDTRKLKVPQQLAISVNINSLFYFDNPTHIDNIASNTYNFIANFGYGFVPNATGFVCAYVASQFTGSFLSPHYTYSAQGVWLSLCPGNPATSKRYWLGLAGVLPLPCNCQPTASDLHIRFEPASSLFGDAVCVENDGVYHSGLYAGYNGQTNITCNPDDGTWSGYLDLTSANYHRPFRTFFGAVEFALGEFNARISFVPIYE